MTQFTSEGQKGNKSAKKSFTKEMAKHVVSQELAWCAKMIAETPVKELRELLMSKELENESLITYTAIKKAMSGDFKPLQWAVEMIHGKPKQQIEQKITEHTVTINIDSDDAKL